MCVRVRVCWIPGKWLGGRLLTWKPSQEWHDSQLRNCANVTGVWPSAERSTSPQRKESDVYQVTKAPTVARPTYRPTTWRQWGQGGGDGGYGGSASAAAEARLAADATPAQARHGAQQCSTSQSMTQGSAARHIKSWHSTAWRSAPSSGT